LPHFMQNLAAQRLLWVPGGADQIHSLVMIIEMFSDF